MRPFALALLLATAAASPVLAAPKEDRPPDRRAEKSEPSKPRAERRARPERAAERTVDRRERRSEARDVSRPSPSRPSLERREERADTPTARPSVIERLRERTREARGETSAPTELRVEPSAARATGDRPRAIEERNLRRAPPIADRSGDQLVEPRRPVPPVLDPDRRIRRVSRTPVPGTEPPPPPTATADIAEPRHRWRDQWRRDRRFDWRDHRRRHRSLFRLSFYLDPFGWGYHRYGVGWRLWPSYYGRNFWLHDPWMYRLPPAYGPYRWIRYYDDALLVNVYTGRVVDVIHDFFW